MRTANEVLRKQCYELEREEKLIDDLLEMMQFMENFVKNTISDYEYKKQFNVFYFYAQIRWMNANFESLNKFRTSYTELADMCSKAKDYLTLANIIMPSGSGGAVDLERNKFCFRCFALEKLHSILFISNFI